MPMLAEMLKQPPREDDPSEEICRAVLEMTTEIEPASQARVLARAPVTPVSDITSDQDHHDSYKSGGATTGPGAVVEAYSPL